MEVMRERWGRKKGRSERERMGERLRENIREMGESGHRRKEKETMGRD